MKNDFDLKAKEWDNDPKKVERAKMVSQEILKVIESGKSMTALEYGCGTGLLSFFLQPYLKKITLFDSSEGMLKVLEKKISNQNIKNMFPQKRDLVQDQDLSEKTDILYTLMTLHHIQDTKKILSRFYEMINNDGYLFIADLDKEDGSFHSHVSDYQGHNGFVQLDLKKLLEDTGFSQVTSHICYTIKKTTDKTNVEYPVFLMTARKT